MDVVRARLALQCPLRARNSFPSSRKLTSVTICRELSDSDQIIKSECSGTDQQLKNERLGGFPHARDHPGPGPPRGRVGMTAEACLFVASKRADNIDAHDVT